MSFFSDKIAERIGGTNFGKNTESYKFTKIKLAKAEAIRKNSNIPLIDLGVGEPDLPADESVVKVLANEAGKSENRFYADNGIIQFQEAAAQYLEKVYGLKNLNPAENIMHGIGTKPILAMLPLCFINPGDITLTTVPGYPVLATYTKYLGGEVYNLPLLAENIFYPDLSQIPAGILKRSKLIYLNYPNNPTGQIATADFFKQVVDFAHKHNIVVIHDAAYGAITFDSKPLSFLTIDGAKEIGIEVHSLSKAFNMTGWRLGFIVGDKKIVEAYGNIKNNTDSGQFRAIQKAGISALSNLNITRDNCDRYSRRFDLLVETLNSVGFNAKKPRGTFYCYVKSPIGTKSGTVFNNAEAASEYLIKNALISTVPWDDAGPYLRFSVTFEADSLAKEKQIMQDLKQRLLKMDLKWN